MLWNGDASGWDAAVQIAIKNGATHLLGMNEPDLATQSNINVTEAVRLWKLYMEPYAGQMKLVSPAVTNGAYAQDGSPMGVNWMSQFLGNCTGCHISAIGMHWYDAWWSEYILGAY